MSTPFYANYRRQGAIKSVMFFMSWVFLWLSAFLFYTYAGYTIQTNIDNAVQVIKKIILLDNDGLDWIVLDGRDNSISAEDLHINWSSIHLNSDGGWLVAIWGDVDLRENNYGYGYIKSHAKHWFRMLTETWTINFAIESSGATASAISMTAPWGINNASDLYIYSNSGSIYFNQGGSSTPSMMISSWKNIWINTVNPESTLTVNWEIKIGSDDTLCDAVNIHWSIKFSWDNFYWCNSNGWVQLN